MYYRLILILMLLLGGWVVQAAPGDMTQETVPTFRDQRVRGLVDSITQEPWRINRTPRLVHRLARLSSPEVVDALLWLAESARSENVRGAALMELSHFDFSMSSDQFGNLWARSMESTDSESLCLVLLDLVHKVTDQGAIVDDLAFALDSETNVVLQTALVRKLGEIGFRNEHRAITALQSVIDTSEAESILKMTAHESLVQLGHFDEICQYELPSSIQIGNRHLLEQPLVRSLTSDFLNSPDLQAVNDASHIRALLREALLHQQFVPDDVKVILSTREAELAFRSILQLRQIQVGRGLLATGLDRNIAGAIRFLLSGVVVR